MKRYAAGMSKVLGKNVRAIRKQKGISLEELSDNTDFTVELIYRIERGEYRMRLEHVRRLAVYLGEQPANLLREGTIEE